LRSLSIVIPAPNEAENPPAVMASIPRVELPQLLHIMEARNVEFMANAAAERAAQAAEQAAALVEELAARATLPALQTPRAVDDVPLELA
jgi:hypothetical protein